jgi:hypothetical protein
VVYPLKSKVLLNEGGFHYPVILYKNFFERLLELKLEEIGNRQDEGNIFLFSGKGEGKLSTYKYSMLFNKHKQRFINNCLQSQDLEKNKYGVELQEMEFGTEILRNTHFLLVKQLISQKIGIRDFSFEHYLTVLRYRATINERFSHFPFHKNHTNPLNED